MTSACGFRSGLVATHVERCSPVSCSSRTRTHWTPRGIMTAAEPGTSAMPRPAATKPRRDDQFRTVYATRGAWVLGQTPNSGASDV